MLEDKRASLEGVPGDREGTGLAAMTLQEILARHGEVGYWCQTDSGGMSPSVHYMFPQDDEHNREIIRAVDPKDDLNFGNAYAREWKSLPNSSFKRRFLAAGPQPVIDDRPL